MLCGFRNTVAVVAVVGGEYRKEERATEQNMTCDESSGCESIKCPLENIYDLYIMAVRRCETHVPLACIERSDANS